MRFIIRLLLILLLPGSMLSAQDSLTVSYQNLDSVQVHAFEQNRSLLYSTAPVVTVRREEAIPGNKSSLLSGLNTLAGVRMEERSPASYRINIRGSSLRAPFGVRNVKVYWNNIPITDPGGNTYFNQFVPNNFNSLEVIKGPAGSLYGAGTGGAILMSSIDKQWKPGLSLEYITGSYNLQNIMGQYRFGKKDEAENIVSYTHIQSDGYRRHSFSRRDNASWVSNITLNGRQQLQANFLFSNMYYQTPGGLNAAEFKADPRAARPAAGGFPSADASKAAIFQKNILAGLTHQYKFNNHFSNTSTLYAAYAHIQNPSFRNYERRSEPHFGLRSHFSYETGRENFHLQWIAGGEWQQGYFNTLVSDNRMGMPDSVQTNDDIFFNNYTLFTQADLTLHNSWIITAGISSSMSLVRFRRLSVFPVSDQEKKYNNEWSPRIAILKKIKGGHALIASVSRGFSPPGIAELLPSTGEISSGLEAEQGINYEWGGRFTLLRNRLQAEINFFYFRINKALVQRKDNSNADYYVNAGNTIQKGIEASLSYYQFFNGSGKRYLSARLSQSLYHFTYGSYEKAGSILDGNWLPSVPAYSLSLDVQLHWDKGFYTRTTLYNASRIYLNDANTVKTPSYQLLSWRLGWENAGSHSWRIYAGADNLFNQNYSLGNDINAAAGRYYNAAAPRNYYVGVGWSISK